MPFFVDGNPTPGEISEALNYLLGNSQQTTSTDLGTGQITDATGNVVSYLYKYLHVKYADSFDGTVNFTNTPTNRTYYGLRNTDDTVESTNPADYIWTKATPPAFGTTYLFYYSVTGGRRIDTLVSMSAPSSLYQPDTGAPIDLDMISGSTGSDGNSARICYAKSTSTTLASTPATYQTSGPNSFPPTNTWGGGETWQATPPSLAVNEALFQSNGIYNPTTDLTTWNAPYLSNLKVGSLSAISADLGSITAGDISIGSSPAISGTTMTGTGSHLYSNGNFITGNSTTNMVFNGSGLYLNGFVNSLTTYTSSITPSMSGTPYVLFTFVISRTGKTMVNLNTYMTAVTNTSTEGVIISVGIQVKNSSGTIVSNNATVGYVGKPIYVTTSPTFKIIGSNQSFNQILDLPNGTYTIEASVSSQSNAYNASGALITGGITFIQLQNIVASTYQVLG